MTSLWADERVYYPIDFEPYTLADYFEKGKQDRQFRTKLTIGVELARRAVDMPIPFRAVVADSFYGEDRGFRQGLRAVLSPFATCWAFPSSDSSDDSVPLELSSRRQSQGPKAQSGKPSGGAHSSPSSSSLPDVPRASESSRFHPFEASSCWNRFRRVLCWPWLGPLETWGQQMLFHHARRSCGTSDLASSCLRRFRGMLVSPLAFRLKGNPVT